MSRLDPGSLSPQALAEACARVMWDGDRASQALGMEIERVAPGEAVVSMTITAAMTNGHGIGHGGYTFTLADSAFAFACNTYNQRTVAQHNTIAFLAPVREGDRLTATAREISRQGRGGIYDVRVVDQNGVTVAEFRGLSRTVKGTHLPEAEEAAPGA
ncbi:hydroxyphenylacetyl-CoA thioesterase PaaI [Salinarimonas sp.]|uniref:hydroxyphenylacetyl-CoA thioesterase PaaI n=1 Tax=Salinarimonas sp. TaxID=2766526 RepID=UPI0032D92AA4